MPIYEYRCEGCAYQFELKQSIKDEPVAVCERCGQAVKRLISSPAIMFKGSGWYVTDYSDKLKPPSNGESAAATGGEKKEATSTAPPAPSATPTNSSATPSTPSAPVSSTSTSPASSTTKT
ncbi:MAG TPA: FmdB family zinc ribbon protein [Nitrospira sp.]